ncbi:response regulator [Azohydromonas aeria]|uniref:response regulator n=1 Tax=Azohydromonas aeria TaxID=2590212 RepID=UPI0018E06292|nr:response regulator [Azohydromonas aeria]
MCLPFVHSELSDDQPCRGAADRAASALRVLVVDDVPANRELLRMLLGHWGHEAETVPGGQDAVRRVAAGGIDLVLMDTEMPGISGLQATRGIRALPGAAGRTPVWAVSAHCLDSDVSQAREAGANGHLGKPVNFAALRGVVTDVAARR